MYFLKPSDERLRSKTNGVFGQMQIRLYQLLLKWLLKSYTCYAISDTISIDKGKIRIVHDFRDVNFEEELRRNWIDIRPKLLTTIGLPMRTEKKRHRINFYFFRFTDVVSVYIDDKELFVKHDNLLTVDGTVEGVLKCSSSEDIIYRTILRIKNDNTSPTSKNIESNSFAYKQSKRETSTKKYNGFEEDESF